MFKNPWHQTIAGVLENLPKELLLENNCYFAGGTSLVFQSAQENWSLGAEYRHSDDIDFVCTGDAFLNMRKLVAAKGIEAVTGGLPQAREARIDQYGIRTILIGPNSPDGVRFEIICEAALKTHTPGTVVNGVTCLSLRDSTALKLMANADRWADRAKYLRDYIDLIAIAHLKKGLPSDGVKDAFDAFDKLNIKSTLVKAHELLQSEGRIKECQNAIQLSAPMTEFLHEFARLAPDVAMAELLDGPPPPSKKKWPRALHQMEANKALEKPRQH